MKLRISELKYLRRMIHVKRYQHEAVLISAFLRHVITSRTIQNALQALSYTFMMQWFVQNYFTAWRVWWFPKHSWTSQMCFNWKAYAKFWRWKQSIHLEISRTWKFDYLQTQFQRQNERKMEVDWKNNVQVLRAGTRWTVHSLLYVTLKACRKLHVQSC